VLARGVFQEGLPEPVEIDGAAMSEVKGDRGASAEIEAVPARCRTQAVQNLSLPELQNLGMKAHGAARRSQT
jgi:hypothetical protein